MAESDREIVCGDIVPDDREEHLELAQPSLMGEQWANLIASETDDPIVSLTLEGAALAAKPPWGSSPPPPPQDDMGDPLVTFSASEGLAALLRVRLDVEGSASRMRSRLKVQALLDELAEIGRQYGSLIDGQGSDQGFATISLLDAGGHVV